LKKIFNGFLTAFSMYSILPVKIIDWNKDTMAYALCFFPFIGVFIALLMSLLYSVLIFLNISSLLFSTSLCLLPIILTGKIHLDGLMDTGDAIGSHQSIDKKLEIMKDPHIGAFGVISCVIYIVVNIALFSQFFIDSGNFFVILISYVLSRAYSAYSIITFKKAKNTGLVYTFSKNSNKNIAKFILITIVAFCHICIILSNTTLGIIVLTVSTISFILYKKFSYKNFNGLTGDLAGHFLCSFETLILFTVLTFNILR